MLTRKPSIQGKAAFANAGDIFDALDPEVARTLAMAAGDVTLVLDDTGTILDSSHNPENFPDFNDFIGQNWLETVTVESRAKLMEMLAAARRGEVQHWRQVNHPGENGDLPMRYVLIAVDNQRIAIGQDMREAARVQQRLLQVQQSLERDYLRLRQTESRYRMLFEMISEPVAILDVATQRVREANPAACAMLGARPGALAGKKILTYFDKPSRDRVLGLIGSAMAADQAAPVAAKIAKGGMPVSLFASGFTQDRGQYLMLRFGLEGEERAGDAAGSPIMGIVDQMPDAFVVADSDLDIVGGNMAFVELVSAASLDQLRGEPLADFVGRPGIDLDLIETQIKTHGSARNVSTVLRARREEGEGEAVELSAVSNGGEKPYYGFVIRPIGRRLRDLPPGSQDLPRSVEQLTDLVGRMSLKDIVRESTDLIERLCIEAALSYTSDNRASAAEILGLSRQSLYSKLHRHGLGNLDSEGDE